MTKATMSKISCLALLGSLAVACGSPQADEENSSDLRGFLEGNGWKLSDSPFVLEPGATIAVCDTGVKEGVQKYVMDAARIWLTAGKRDERVKVVAGCEGTRVIRLVKAPAGVSYYGQALPLRGNVHQLDVPPHWASFWTANHEVGHVFGFAHIFNNVTSIMNSEGNGKFMNEGQLAEYDFSEVIRMLKRSEFTKVNEAWASSGGGLPSSDLFVALDLNSDTAESALYVSTSDGVASVAVCESETIEQCQAKIGKMSLLSSPSATRNNRKFFKTDGRMSLSAGKTFAILALDSSNKVMKSLGVRVDAK